MKPILAVVGGFLGAGKTTLILTAAALLRQRGLRPAAILNDQGRDLVDSHYVAAVGVDCDQVTGGCFCCRFPDLLNAAGRLLEFDPDIIFAEAVGSCIDIVATTLRPLMREQGERFQIAPLTVILHPQGSFDNPLLDFLYRNQIAEADILFARGESVHAWLNKILSCEGVVGGKTLDIDYARYGEAEAALAWLNLRVTSHSSPAISAPMLIGPLLDRLEPLVRIVHLKLFVQSDAGYLKAALTGNGPEPMVEGALDQSPSEQHDILLNIRALNDPDALRAIVENEFSTLPVRLEWRYMECFLPAAPVPYHRG